MGRPLMDYARTVDVARAQSEVRTAYRSGSVGQVYSGFVWVASASAWAVWTPTVGILTMLVGGFFIYPVTSAVSRLLGGAGRIGRGNPFRELGVTAPIVGPLCMPVAGAAALHDINWFFPAFMVIMGAHYLPFSTLYGMRSFVWLGAAMWTGGIVVGWWVPELAVLAGGVTGVVLIGFGLVAGKAHDGFDSRNPHAGPVADNRLL
jgi:hypothetical protein